MKYRVKKGTTFDEISKFLSPVVQYGEEKQRKNMSDDWDELSHTSNWLKKVLEAINREEGDTLDIYYLEEEQFLYSRNKLARYLAFQPLFLFRSLIIETYYTT